MSKRLKRMMGMIVLLTVAVLVLALLVRRFEARFAFFPFAGESQTPAQFGVPFAPLTIETTDGERLRAWHLPRADAVAQIVYFHGNGGNLSVWADVLVGVWRHGYDVIAVDYRGFGVSTGTPSEQGLYRDADATITFVDAQLRRQELPLVYWGRSLGAAVAAYAASRRPPDGVVLEAGFPSARAVFQGDPLMLTLTLFATYRFATSEWMTTVTAPVLVMHGDSDSVIPFQLGQRLYESLRGPKRFVRIARGAHNDPEPPDAQLYWGAVAEFVSSLRPPQ
jgi:uncharacterized protein